MRTDPATSVSLEGRTFAGVQTTTGGEVDDQTRFRYHQDGDIVWATYSGGSVVHGHLVGTRCDDHLEFRYVHLNLMGDTSSGVCSSDVVVLPDGRIRLSESWVWESRPGGGRSLVDEVR